MPGADTEKKNGAFVGFTTELMTPEGTHTCSIYIFIMYMYIYIYNVVYIYIYGYGSVPINTIFRGMNIHKSQLF